MASASSSMTFQSLRQSIRAGKFVPVYILHGEEGYYIDELVKDFENILSPEDKEFNQFILYAPEVEPGAIMDICRGVPMMSEHQVVIVKEAQEVRADKLKKLAPYIESPNPSTILVVCSRGEAIKSKELKDAAKKSGAVFFESRKVADYQIPQLVGEYIKSKGLSFEPKAAEMLRDFIGSNLSRMYNEIDKLATVLPGGACVTADVVERNIGISKDYNTYELVDAVVARDAAKIFRILAYIRANPKNIPLQVATVAIFGLFADLLVAHYTPDKSEAGLMAALGKSAWQLRNINKGLQNYSAVRIVEIISAIRRFDAMSKGVLSRQNEQDLFHDLMYHILTAPGRI